MERTEGRIRVVIERVSPEIDGGRFPIKRIVGDTVVVEADIFADGHDALSGLLLYRKAQDRDWAEVPLAFLINDRWTGAFRVAEPGRYLYTVIAWTDRFKSWRRDLAKKVEAGQDVAIDLLIGAGLLRDAARHASGPDAQALARSADELAATGAAP
ncbi:MAG: hypothetical protein KatS3mg082_0449 [Nitrospiraceae bacterium]|nr:MAG: hypothetical protein KatS3mg082_0449 [Nitrospiraceae bacterium]